MKNIEELDEELKKTGLPLKTAEQFAARYSLSIFQLESIALEKGIMPLRFIRNNLSCHEQLRLFQSKVGVIGCGGLGGLASALLTRIGIGALHLVDPDKFEEHNLNRQHFCTIESIGKSKVTVIKSQLLKINPAVHCTYSQNFFNESDIKKLDAVIDCLDSATGRRKLDTFCKKYDTPLVHGAVTKWYSQTGISSRRNDLISTLYRNNTSKNNIHPEQTLAPTVSITASLQVAETVKLLLGYPSELEKMLLSCDLLTPEFEKSQI